MRHQEAQISHLFLALPIPYLQELNLEIATPRSDSLSLTAVSNGKSLSFQLTSIRAAIAIMDIIIAIMVRRCLILGYFLKKFDTRFR